MLQISNLEGAYGRNAHDYFTNVVVDDDDNVYCIGHCCDASGITRGLVVKYDKDLKEIGSVKFNVADTHFTNATIAFNELVVVGSHDNEPGYVIVKFDSDLNFIKSYTSTRKEDVILSVAINSVGETCCCGYCIVKGTPEASRSRGIVIKLSSDFDVIEYYTHRGENSRFSDIVTDEWDNVITVGHVITKSENVPNGIVVKLSDELTPLGSSIHKSKTSKSFYRVTVDWEDAIVCVEGNAGRGTCNKIILYSDDLKLIHKTKLNNELDNKTNKIDEHVTAVYGEDGAIAVCSIVPGSIAPSVILTKSWDDSLNEIEQAAYFLEINGFTVAAVLDSCGNIVCAGYVSQDEKHIGAVVKMMAIAEKEEDPASPMPTKSSIMTH